MRIKGMRTEPARRPYKRSKCVDCGRVFSYAPWCYLGIPAQCGECFKAKFAEQYAVWMPKWDAYERERFTQEERYLMIEASIEILWGEGDGALTSQQKEQAASIEKRHREVYTAFCRQFPPPDRSRREYAKEEIE